MGQEPITLTFSFLMGTDPLSNVVFLTLTRDDEERSYSTNVQTYKYRNIVAREEEETSFLLRLEKTVRQVCDKYATNVLTDV
jgi:hypothetical protein